MQIKEGMQMIYIFLGGKKMNNIPLKQVPPPASD